MVMLAAVITSLGSEEEVENACFVFFFSWESMRQSYIKILFSIRGLFDLGKTTEYLKSVQFIEMV